jgi:hypothetical protein
MLASLAEIDGFVTRLRQFARRDVSASSGIRKLETITDTVAFV